MGEHLVILLTEARSVWGEVVGSDLSDPRYKQLSLKYVKL